MRSSDKITVCQIGAFHKAAGKTPSNADSLKENLQSIGIETVWASKYTNRIARLLDMMFTICRHCGRYRLIILHVYSGPAFLWSVMTAIFAKLLGKKLILWLHGGNLPNYYKIHPEMVDFVFKKADYIVSPSPYLAEAFQKKFKIDILPYELPVKTYPFRKRESIEPKLFWLRAFAEGYNPMMAPKVVSLLKNNYPDISLAMCGPDNGDGSFNETKALSRELGVEENISFPGLVTKDQIKEYGEKCDIFINTTNYDNTPVSVIEAMAMGMCVVSTDVGGIPFLVHNGEDGILTPPNSPEAMAEASEDLLSNPDLAIKISVNARKKAELFDWEYLSEKWKAIITGLHFRR